MKVDKLRSNILAFILNRSFLLVVGIVIFFNLFIGSGVDIANDVIAPLPVCEDETIITTKNNESAVSDEEVTVSNEDEGESNDDCLKEREKALDTRSTIAFFFKTISGSILVISGLMHIRRRLLGVSFVVSGITSIVIGILGSGFGGFELFIVTGCILIVLILLALRQVSR